MIDAKDLRLGNIVKCVGRPITVDYELIGFINACNFDGHSKCYDNIPLTEEWLLKAGFKKAAISNRFTHDLLHEYIFTGNGFYMNGVLPELKYVHQLQNLYHALTGQELTFTHASQEAQAHP